VFYSCMVVSYYLCFVVFIYIFVVCLYNIMIVVIIFRKGGAYYFCGLEGIIIGVIYWIVASS